MPTLWESTKEKLGIVLVTGAVSIATIFSDRITSAIKTEINKADHRPVEHEKISKDVSLLLFHAENSVEFASLGLTTKPQLHFVIDPYNTAIEDWRKNEYVYLASITRYWDEPAISLYENFSKDVKILDKAMHAYNPEYSLVESGEKKIADAKIIQPLTEDAQKALSNASSSAKKLLFALSK